MSTGFETKPMEAARSANNLNEYCNPIDCRLSDFRWCATTADATQLLGLAPGISSPKWLPPPDGTGLLMPESDHAEVYSA